MPDPRCSTGRDGHGIGEIHPLLQLVQRKKTCVHGTLFRAKILAEHVPELSRGISVFTGAPRQVKQPTCKKDLLFMAAHHPLHELFRQADVPAADSTTLELELHCRYCAKIWTLHKHPSGERQGKFISKHCVATCCEGATTAAVTFALSLPQPARTTRTRV